MLWRRSFDENGEGAIQKKRGEKGTGYFKREKMEK
jgi:hypothetical protein